MRAFDIYNGIMSRTYGVAVPRRRYQANTNQWKACTAIAELCLDQNWNVEEFITETMRLMRRNATLMHPKQLMHPKVVALYKQDHDRGVLLSSPANTWAYFVTNIRDKVVNTGAEAAGLLFSPFTAYPEWFRIVYLEQVEDRTYELYADTARAQLAERADLRAFIRKTVPGRLEALEQRWGFFGDGAGEPE